MTELKEQDFRQVDFEKVDTALYRWIDKVLNPFCSTLNGWKKVPVIWSLPERSFMAKNLDENRDCEGGLILPLISINRTSVEKSKDQKWSIWSNGTPFYDKKTNSIPISRKVNQKKTSDFQNNDFHQEFSTFQRKNKRKKFALKEKAEKVVYETVYVPIPIALFMHYEISIKTQHQQQMNEILEPFLAYSGNVNFFFLKDDGIKFPVYLEDSISFNNEHNGVSSEERKYESVIRLKVIGEMTNHGPNQKTPDLETRENPVDINIKLDIESK